MIDCNGHSTWKTNSNVLRSDAFPIWLKNWKHLTSKGHAAWNVYFCVTRYAVVPSLFLIFQLLGQQFKNRKFFHIYGAHSPTYYPSFFCFYQYQWRKEIQETVIKQPPYKVSRIVYCAVNQSNDIWIFQNFVKLSW